MAAEIKPTPGQGVPGNMRKMQLVNKIDGSNDDINMAILIPKEDGVISVSDDRTVRVWLKRDTGQFWPSICHSMPTAASCMDYHHDTRRLFIGMDNGTIAEYRLSDDFNSMTHKRDYLAHQSRVTAIRFILQTQWVLSCARDKYFQWHCAETGRRLGGYQTSAWCTCLQFDFLSKYVFVGDYSGQISVLKIHNNVCEMITTLKGHSGSVRCLTWDEDRSHLFSGSFDQSIIVWDIGGQKGTAFELQGHHDKVSSLFYMNSARQLVSAGEDCIVAFWDMDMKRQETPEWVESDQCQKCSTPFFWNVRSMWENKTVGVRQHHCRKCGKAICNKCSEARSTIPIMGYEYDVRVCEECKDLITDEDRAPMATFHDSKHSILYIDMDVRKKMLLTVGKDKVMKLFDVSSLVQ